LKYDYVLTFSASNLDSIREVEHPTGQSAAVGAWRTTALFAVHELQIDGWMEREFPASGSQLKVASCMKHCGIGKMFATIHSAIRLDGQRYFAQYIFGL
jgi:hypothetical protein